MRPIVCVLLFLAIGCRVPPAPVRIATATTVARLGYPDSARLLVLHADDMAMTLGVTRATLAALRADIVNSASIIATSPYLDALSTALRGHGSYDLGVHLTLTSESDRMRWAPAAGAARAPSLVDSTGMLPRRVRTEMRPEEIERELEAQIENMRTAGIIPTHLDSHQGALYFNGGAVFDAWRRVAKRACLPIPVPEAFFGEYPYLKEALTDGHVQINDMVIINPSVAVEDWARFYHDAVRSLKPGVSMLIVHLGEYTDAEREQFSAHRGWGADWRARDVRVLSDPAFRQLLRDENVHLVTWRELAAATRLCGRG